MPNSAAAQHLTTTARVSDRWNFLHDEIGYNYRMPNINAALGCAQLEQLPARCCNEKRQLARRYEEAFVTLDGVRFLREPAWYVEQLLAQRHRA